MYIHARPYKYVTWISVNDTVGPQGAPKHHKRQSRYGQAVTRRGGARSAERTVPTHPRSGAHPPRPHDSHGDGAEVLYSNLFAS